MDDFIFGPLPPVGRRMQAVLDRRAGITHQQARQPLDPQPGQPVRLHLMVGPSQHCDRAWVYWNTGGEDPQGSLGSAASGQVTAMQLVDSEWDTPLWGYVRHFQATLPGQPAGTVLRYCIGAAGPDGREQLADQGAQYSFYVDNDPPPAWTRDAVLYQIFVDRFFPGSGRDWLQPENLMGFYGGTINGITEKLDYLSSLGVTVLWLSPIFPSPSHHGYDASDYLDIEPRLGTRADLRALVDEAHRRGMRILLDLVPNHFSNFHPFFLQASSDPLSPYRDWFTFKKWPKKYVTFFGALSMPKVNLRHPAARQYLLDAAAYWLEFGVDGFRVDHAVGPAPDFWADFRRVTRAAKPDSWTFGEVTDPPPVQLLYGGGMDGCLDFMLAEALRETFAYHSWNAARFADFIERHDAFFPPDYSRPSFFDNHDMNRFLWAARGDQRWLRLAATCQFTLPGPPVIYHGTEVGLSQEHDVHEPGRGLEEARLPHPWGAQQDGALLAFFQALIALRRRLPVLRSGRRQALAVDEHLFAYTLTPPGGEAQEAVCVALNLSEQERTVTLAGRWGQVLLASEPGCAASVEGDSTQVQLAPLAGMILETSSPAPSPGR